MKEIEDMNRKEVVDEINTIDIHLAAHKEEYGKDYENDDLYDRYEDLENALTHNFPHMIGSKDDDPSLIHDDNDLYNIHD